MFRKNKKSILFYIAVIGLLIFLYLLGVLSPVEKIVIKSLNPLINKVYTLSSGIRIKYNEQKNKQDLVQTVKELQSEITVLTLENVKYKTTEEENELLREHLRFLTKNDHEFVMANVISRGDIEDFSGRTETILIDKGSLDGIYSGLAAVSQEGVIIGKVAEVKNNISKIYLSNNKNCKLAAAILNEDKTSGIAEGELGLTIKMEFIPQSEEINVNDVVVTSGLEQPIPRGLVIGRVTEISKENNELWQSAQLSTMKNPEDLIIVSVLLPKQ